MSNMNKKTWWTLGGIAAAVIIVLTAGFYYKYNYNHSGGPGYSSEPMLDPSLGPGNPLDQSSSSPGTQGKLSYSDAVKKYGGNRIQFDQSCQAHPNNFTFKQKTQAMFDNRSAATIVINFNDVKYSIPAYDYKVISMTSPNGYPVRVFADCNSSKNVVNILIEK